MVHQMDSKRNNGIMLAPSDKLTWCCGENDMGDMGSAAGICGGRRVEYGGLCRIKIKVSIDWIEAKKHSIFFTHRLPIKTR